MGFSLASPDMCLGSPLFTHKAPLWSPFPSARGLNTSGNTTATSVTLDDSVASLDDVREVRVFACLCPCVYMCVHECACA